ncbi:PH domain-containing protein [Humibacillus xanthopallidus]|uniref:PH (Pleckstrin Homology) domain-containing protein n=1 Tax=Humibacillus xanthopallidus TaxID=412689 RepID=A0A543HJ34_9MICO|nr:PH domain-containing protein [Humibacillus xanthopallidus]TQM58300.1 PH (Pleckstrin Homology) domain-containing protein [Humibacillus xanthopallidus]
MSSPTGPSSRDADPAPDAFATFRSRRGRAVALGVAWTALIVFGGLAVLMPVETLGHWSIIDRLMFFALGVVIAVVAWRYASISAVPSREGLIVRNLVLTRTLTWPEVVGVQFGGGEPWVTLDLDDGDTLAVMAIQKADGEVSGREASRLAALVQAFGESRHRDGDGPQRAGGEGS